jgi:hypothetical protein
MIDDVPEIEVVVAHSERVTLRVGERVPEDRHGSGAYRPGGRGPLLDSTRTAAGTPDQPYLFVRHAVAACRLGNPGRRRH